MNEQVCVLTHRHDPDRPRSAIEGLLCAGCVSRLNGALAELPGLWDSLEEVLAGEWNERVTDDRWPLAVAEHALPLKPAVAEHRRDIAQQLASWARLVAEEMGQHPPVPDVGRIVGWLCDRQEWVFAQPWVDDYAHEVLALRSRARPLLDNVRTRRIPCGPCPATVDNPLDPALAQVPCPGTLIARLGRDMEDHVPPTCDHCGEVVPVDHHAALRRGLAGLVDTQAAAEHLGIPASTIRRWGSEGKIKREGRDADGRSLWRLDRLDALKREAAEQVSAAIRARLADRIA